MHYFMTIREDTRIRKLSRFMYSFGPTISGVKVHENCNQVLLLTKKTLEVKYKKVTKKST